MTKLYITETSGVNNLRHGFTHICRTLSAAKRDATKRQMFAGTVMTIEWNGYIISSKVDGKWRDSDHAAYFFTKNF